MVSLKEAVDRPTSPPGHVYFSLSDEEIPSDESIDIRLEKEESMIGGTPLLVDIPSGISCHLLLNLLDDALCMLKAFCFITEELLFNVDGLETFTLQPV
ncbi:unnamed protein product [Sphagnum troendelagicum]|uniref:Uncharacterized protein n=1 Tax=Sphagnum troendelagicum TaxID=128251 RepID=A0ABP0UCC4_9BRYO